MITMKREEGYFRGFNDSELFYQSWIAQKANGTIIITHGLSEHSECYQRFANGLKPLNINIYGWDLRGHGRSEGKRGVVYDFFDLCEDLKIFIKYVQDRQTNMPIFLLGHSMGGLVCNKMLLSLNESEFKAMNLDGLILSSPLCGLSICVPKLLLTAGKFCDKWFPDIAFRRYDICYNKLSRDRDVINEYKHDHLRHDKISPRLFFSLKKECQYVLDHASKITLPIIVMQGSQDTVVSVDATKAYFEKITSSDKTLKIYEGYHHEIFNDIGREKVYSDLISWTKNRLQR